MILLSLILFSSHPSFADGAYLGIGIVNERVDDETYAAITNALNSTSSP